MLKMRSKRQTGDGNKPFITHRLPDLKMGKVIEYRSEEEAQNSKKTLSDIYSSEDSSYSSSKEK